MTTVYVIQQGGFKDEPVDDDGWVDLWGEHKSREDADQLWPDAVSDYGSVYRLRIVERVTTEKEVRRNYL